MRIRSWALVCALGVLLCAVSVVSSAHASASSPELPSQWRGGSADSMARRAGLAVSTPTPVPVATPAPIVAPGAVSTPEEPSYLARGHAALGRVGFDLGSVGYTISFHPGTSSHRGLTFTRRHHIEVYVRPSMSDSELGYVIGHEMGHAVDHIRNTTVDRERWRSARGISATTPWWPNGLGNDFATPAGDFAECFASWAVGSGSHSTWGSCGAVIGLVAELAYD